MKVKFLPAVVQAEYVNDYVLDVTFNDGTQKRVDFAPWLSGPVFEPLRKKAYFRKFFIEGATVGWPNGADIAPETLYDAPPFVAKAKKPVKRTKIAR